MQVQNSNNVKIYNLSCGKSLPDWLSERKRRLLQRKNVDYRRSIELIQDFDMPDVSTKVKMSRDGKYILATGIYKPRIRCFDVDNLSLKFERCFNSEAVQFELLDDDYSKMVLLQCDRTVEFHAKYGLYYQTRIPKFGRDMAYHRESCDLYLVGASSEVYRFNLERGSFLNPLQTNASSCNKININPIHHMVTCGTMEGTIECWDPRTRQRIGILDCALSCVTDNTIVDGFPSITALSFKDALTIAVGTFTGQILLYDIRTNKPFVVKDHMYSLPIKNVEFIKNQDLIASLDPKCVKFWSQTNGKPYTAIQAPVHLNDMCFVPDTGLLFLANEEKKILTYFLPSIGPAPKWCSFLDSISEELEESKQDAVYDDYKFVTKKELAELNLEHLHGTNLLRAYMHGYFMDIRLYNKANAIAQSSSYKDMRKKLVRSKIDSERPSHVIVKNLPTVNQEYAQKLLEKKTTEKLKDPTPYEDDRFKEMFENVDFKIDENDDEYTRVKSIVEKMHKKKVAIVAQSEQFAAMEDEEKIGSAESSDDEEHDSDEDEEEESSTSEPDDDAKSPGGKKRLFKAMDSEKFSLLSKDSKQENDAMLPIGDRLQELKDTFKQQQHVGGDKVVTFTLKKSEKQTKKDEERRAHLEERKKFRRPVKNFRK